MMDAVPIENVICEIVTNSERACLDTRYIFFFGEILWRRV
jgi:hypothetical protein